MKDASLELCVSMRAVCVCVCIRQRHEGGEVSIDVKENLIK